MNNFKQLQQSYLKEKAAAKDNLLAMRKNEDERQKLKQQLANVRQEHQKSETRLSNAVSDMAQGTLTNEGYLELKNQVNALFEQIETLTELIKAQEQAYQSLKGSDETFRLTLKDYKQSLAGLISQNLFNEIKGNETLQNLIYSFFAAQDTKLFLHKKDKSVFYQIFGENLIRSVFSNLESGCPELPDFYESFEQVESMIAKL